MVVEDIPRERFTVLSANLMSGWRPDFSPSRLLDARHFIAIIRQRRPCQPTSLEVRETPPPWLPGWDGSGNAP